MKYYIVETKIIYSEPIRVRAASVAEALEKACVGDGEEVGDRELVGGFNSKDWKVELDDDQENNDQEE